MKTFKRDLSIAADRADYELTQDQLEYLLSKEDKMITTMSFVDLIYFFIECNDNGFDATVKKYKL